MKNKIASFGEIVWDCFGDSKTLGGAPLNFAYFCAKFGCDSAIISAVGNDGLGRAALAKIAEIRLDARAVAVLPDLPTGIVDVSEGSDGLPAYNIRRPAAWDEIGAFGSRRGNRGRLRRILFRHARPALGNFEKNPFRASGNPKTLLPESV